MVLIGVSVEQSERIAEHVAMTETTDQADQPIAPWNDPESWHTQALTAVKAHVDEGLVFVAASAESDGRFFVYLRANLDQVRDLHKLLGDIVERNPE